MNLDFSGRPHQQQKQNTGFIVLAPAAADATWRGRMLDCWSKKLETLETVEFQEIICWHRCILLLPPLVCGRPWTLNLNFRHTNKNDHIFPRLETVDLFSRNHRVRKETSGTVAVADWSASGSVVYHVGHGPQTSPKNFPDTPTDATMKKSTFSYKSTRLSTIPQNVTERCEDIYFITNGWFILENKN